MVLKLAERIAINLYKNGYIEEDEVKIYRYGYTIIIDGIVDYAILFILGILTGKLIPVCIFAVVFSTIRQFSGGYHADKRWKCILLSSSLCLACIFIPYLIPKSIESIYLYIITIISTIIIIKNAPVENKAKKLDELLKKANRHRAAIASVCFMSMIFILSIIYTKAALTAANSMLAVSILMKYSLWKDR